MDLALTDAPPATDVPELDFPDGIPGFPEARRFVLGDLTDDGVFQLLRSLDHPDLSMVVCAPWLFFPDYAPEIDLEDQRDLGLDTPEDAMVFCAVNADDAGALHVNLLGPFVVNATTHRGRQVVLAAQDLPVRAPIPA